MLKKMLFIATTAMVLSMPSSIVLASGSDLAKGAKTGDTQLYNVGKQVYKEKYACKSCPMASKTLDKESAAEVLAGKEMSDLSEREAKGLQVYLKKKFDL